MAEYPSGRGHALDAVGYAGGTAETPYISPLDNPFNFSVGDRIIILVDGKKGIVVERHDQVFPVPESSSAFNSRHQNHRFVNSPLRIQYDVRHPSNAESGYSVTRFYEFELVADVPCKLEVSDPEESDEENEQRQRQ